MPGNNSSAMVSKISSWSLERWFDIDSENLFQLSRIIQESPDTGSVLLVSRTGQKISRKKLNFELLFAVVWNLARFLAKKHFFDDEERESPDHLDLQRLASLHWST